MNRSSRCAGVFPGNLVEAGKIQIAAIHDIDGPRLEDQLVADIDIVDFSRCDDHHGRNISMQIQKGVESRLVPFTANQLDIAAMISSLVYHRLCSEICL